MTVKSYSVPSSGGMAVKHILRLMVSKNISALVKNIWTVPNRSVVSRAGWRCAAAAAVYFEWRIKKRVGGCRQEEEGI